MSFAALPDLYALSLTRACINSFILRNNCPDSVAHTPIPHRAVLAPARRAALSRADSAWPVELTHPRVGLDMPPSAFSEEDDISVSDDDSRGPPGPTLESTVPAPEDIKGDMKREKTRPTPHRTTLDFLSEYNCSPASYRWHRRELETLLKETIGSVDAPLDMTDSERRTMADTAALIDRLLVALLIQPKVESTNAKSYQQVVWAARDAGCPKAVIYRAACRLAPAMASDAMRTASTKRKRRE